MQAALIFSYYKFLAINIKLTMPRNKRTIASGIHNGDNTQSHDQSIMSVSLSHMNRSVSAPVNDIDGEYFMLEIKTY